MRTTTDDTRDTTGGDMGAQTMIATDFPARPKGAHWTFDDFAPGLVLGTAQIPLDAARIARWEAIYGPLPAQAPTLPRGMLVAAMVETSLLAGAPRPKGNIHAGQKLRFAGPAPRPGDVVEVRALCQHKELKRERRWITLRTEARIAGRTVCIGEYRIIWAA